MTNLKTTALALALAMTAGAASAGSDPISSAVKMSASESNMAKACMAMTAANMMKDLNCMKLQKMYPEVMKRTGMMKSVPTMKMDDVMKSGGATKK